MTWYLWAYVIYQHELLRYMNGYTSPKEYANSLLSPNMLSYAKWMTQH